MTSTSLIDSVVNGREVGHYTLPDALLTAHDVAKRIAGLALPPYRQVHYADAGAGLVDAAARGEETDVAGLLDELRGAVAEAAARRLAELALVEAREVAATRLVSAVRATADETITGHLRPAHDDVLEQARRAVADLDQHPPVPAELINASAKVRKAYGRLGELAHRLDLIRRARSTIINVTGQAATHDVNGLFAGFADPLVFFGGQPVPASARIPAPPDPIPRLVWLVGDAAPAGPWLPTVAEQDDAWQASAYGERTRQLEQASLNAQAIGARGAVRVGRDHVSVL